MNQDVLRCVFQTAKPKVKGYITMQDVWYKISQPQYEEQHLNYVCIINWAQWLSLLIFHSIRITPQIPCCEQTHHNPHGDRFGSRMEKSLCIEYSCWSLLIQDNAMGTTVSAMGPNTLTLVLTSKRYLLLRNLCLIPIAVHIKCNTQFFLACNSSANNFLQSVIVLSNKESRSANQPLSFKRA